MLVTTNKSDRIRDMADDTPLSAITSAMGKFETTVGLPKREEKSVDGCTFTTGTVFVNVVPKSTVPSTIVLPGSGQKLRVWHRGQVPTCFKCGSRTHLAKDCGQHKNNSASAGNSTLYSRIHKAGSRSNTGQVMDPEREVHDSSTAASEMTTCTDGAAGQSAVQGGVQTCQTTDMLSQTIAILRALAHYIENPIFVAFL